MSTANIFYALAGLFILGGMAYVMISPARLLPGLTFLTGLGFAIMSLIFSPNVVGWSLWIPVISIIAAGGMFIGGLLMEPSSKIRAIEVCNVCGLPHTEITDPHEGEEENDGVSEVQQGQDDGLVPEGPEDHS